MVGKRLSVFEKPELVAHDGHQVRGILAVVDGEGRIEADALGVLAQQPRADAVEGAGPGQRVGRRAARCRRGRVAGDALDARASISAAARREKVSSRIRRGSAPLTIEMRHAVASVLVLPEPAPAMTSSGPARARARSDAVLDREALLRIERRQEIDGRITRCGGWSKNRGR